VEPDVDPLLSELDVDPLGLDDDPLLIDELLSIELEDPLLREEPVESPEVLIPAPLALDAPTDTPPVPPAPPAPAPPAPPPTAARR
jgi:hypothetical protein